MDLSKIFFPSKTLRNGVDRCARPCAELLLFILLPTVVVALCNKWITWFMWFNRMEFVVFVVERLYPGLCDERQDDIVLPPPDSISGQLEPSPPPAEQCAEIHLCDHCHTTDTLTPTIHCPFNHRICLTCLSEHATVQHGDPELLCLHPDECGLAFEEAELQSLPQAVLENLVSLAGPPGKKRADEKQGHSTIVEEDAEEGREKAVDEEEDAYEGVGKEGSKEQGEEDEEDNEEEGADEEQEEENEEDGVGEDENRHTEEDYGEVDDDDSDSSDVGWDAGLADISEEEEDTADRELDASVALAGAITNQQVDIRKPRRTHVNIEEVYVTPEDVSPGFHQVLIKIEEIELSPLTPLGALQLQLAHNLSGTTVGRDDPAPVWDAKTPLDSVTAPPAPSYPEKVTKHVTFRRASSLPPFNGADAAERAILADVASRASLDRDNAQARLRYARKRVDAGKWAPERLEKAQRERAEAGEKYEQAQRALNDYDRDNGVKLPKRRRRARR